MGSVAGQTWRHRRLCAGAISYKSGFPAIECCGFDARPAAMPRGYKTKWDRHCAQSHCCAVSCHLYRTAIVPAQSKVSAA